MAAPDHGRLLMSLGDLDLTLDHGSDVTQPGQGGLWAVLPVEVEEKKGTAAGLPSPVPGTDLRLSRGVLLPTQK